MVAEIVSSLMVLAVLSVEMARTRAWGQRGFPVSDNWRSEEPRFVGVVRDQVGDSGSSPGEGPGIFKEQLTAAATVEKLTFALLDRIFQGCPSLLEDIKKTMKQQVS